MLESHDLENLERLFNRIIYSSAALIFIAVGPFMFTTNLDIQTSVWSSIATFSIGISVGILACAALIKICEVCASYPKLAGIYSFVLLMMAIVFSFTEGTLTSAIEQSKSTVVMQSGIRRR